VDQQLIQQQEWLLNHQKDLVREVLMMDQLLVQDQRDLLQVIWDQVD
jgi:hypothetical protein